MNDTTVHALLVITLVCHLAVISIGYKIKKTTVSISYVNAIFVIAMFIYWGFTILKIKQHQFQFRELVLLSLEACILVFALYSIMGFHNKTYVKVINHIGFWFHLLTTIGMLIFMSIFKLKHLF